MTTTACDGAVRAADKVRHPSRVHVSLTQSVSQSVTYGSAQFNRHGSVLSANVWLFSVPVYGAAKAGALIA